MNENDFKRVNRSNDAFIVPVVCELNIRNGGNGAIGGMGSLQGDSVLNEVVDEDDDESLSDIDEAAPDSASNCRAR